MKSLNILVLLFALFIISCSDDESNVVEPLPADTVHITDTLYKPFYMSSFNAVQELIHHSFLDLPLNEYNNEYYQCLSLNIQFSNAFNPAEFSSLTITGEQIPKFVMTQQQLIDNYDATHNQLYIEHLVLPYIYGTDLLTFTLKNLKFISVDEYNLMIYDTEFDGTNSLNIKRISNSQLLLQTYFTFLANSNSAKIYFLNGDNIIDTLSFEEKSTEIMIDNVPQTATSLYFEVTTKREKFTERFISNEVDFGNIIPGHANLLPEQLSISELLVTGSDDNLLIYQSGRNSIYYFSIEEQKITQEIQLGGEIQSLTIADNKVYYGLKNDGLYVMDESSNITKLIHNYTDYYSLIVIDDFLYASDRTNIIAYKIENDGLTLIQEYSFGDDLENLKYNRTNNILYGARYGGNYDGYLIYRMEVNPESGELTNEMHINNEGSNSNKYDFSKNGELIYTSSGKVFKSSNDLNIDLTEADNLTTDFNDIIVDENNLVCVSNYSGDVATEGYKGSINILNSNNYQTENTLNTYYNPREIITVGNNYIVKFIVDSTIPRNYLQVFSKDELTAKPIGKINRKYILGN